VRRRSARSAPRSTRGQNFASAVFAIPSGVRQGSPYGFALFACHLSPSAQFGGLPGEGFGPRVGGAGDAAGASPISEGRWAVYARSSTIMAQSDRIDDGIALVNDELMSMMADIDGCIGVSLLVDRSSGRCIATSSWDSEEAMHASNEKLQPVRQRLLETLGGDGLEVQEWEIAIFHRDHQSPAGACARVTWARPPAGQLDTAVEAFKTNVLPLLENQDGFCGASMLIDREAGMLCGTVSFDSMATVAGNRAFGAMQRAKMTEQTGIEFVDVVECELAVHHLRVPELV